MAIDVNEGRSLYASGSPLPGEYKTNDPGTRIISGYAGGDIPFGRVIGDYTIQSDGHTKLYAPITDASTKAGGVSAYSYDAIGAPTDLKYQDDDPVAVVEEGNVVCETDEELALDGTAIGVVNGAGSGDSAAVGKLTNQTGTGYSTTTNIKLIKRWSSTLAEVQISGPIALVAG